MLRSGDFNRRGVSRIMRRATAQGPEKRFYRELNYFQNENRPEDPEMTLRNAHTL